MTVLRVRGYALPAGDPIDPRRDLAQLAAPRAVVLRGRVMQHRA